MRLKSNFILQSAVFTFLSLLGFGVILNVKWFGLSELDVSRKIELLISIAIMIFAFIEGFSTLAQASLQNKQNQLEDLKDALSNGYGPLINFFRFKFFQF